ncbi:hypothetical protein DKX38_030003 [Salix brachista]|uniref:Receptor-like serine/threonine-protein kinase n=1 Tax=Salix brachista TaxID=2182728 RepID=A0A5N5J5E3_9ROSI|nr:hypothetical protein DKX38_030003 [Salix brachista]
MHSWLMARRGPNQRDLRAMHSMLSTVFFSYAFFLCCFARDTITYPSGSIDYDGQETLVSAGKRFELGFFTPEETTDFRSYLGIWYHRSDRRIVVWVANRNRPLLDVGASFAITKDGNLQILDRSGTSCWSTTLASTSNPAYREAKLLDSGNLVFGDSNKTLWTTILWQSFEHPTDTFLSGMKMSENLKLISWESGADPKEGNFTFQLDEGRFVILTNGESSDLSISERMPDGMKNFLSNTTGSDNNTRIRLDVEGELQYWNFNVSTDWTLQRMAPREKCSVYNACGNFGSCNLYNMLACRCLPGFKPASPESWRNGSFSGGCNRSSAVCGKNDTFLRLKMMRVGQQDKKIAVENETICREECLNNCSCQAYSFVEEVNRRREPITCLIWTDALKGLQEEYSFGRPDLFVRVSKTDTALKAKSCEPCGLNVIPYPLSTGSDCGDPMYFSFHCDNSTGKLSFKTQNGTYNVTTIDQDKRTFVIQDKDVDHCNSSTRGHLRKFNLSFPFKMNAFKPRCDTVAGNFGSNISSQGLVEIVIGWEPPREPLCTSSADCEDWANSSCNVAGNDIVRCHCNSNFRWDGMALKCVQGEHSISFFKLQKHIFLYTCILMRKKAKRRESQQNTDRNAALMYGTEKRAWRFWREDKALDLMDKTLHESCNTNEFLRCLNAALLCVQDDPADRPTMSNVVLMLSSEIANLPVPKEPAFSIRRGFSGIASTSSKQERGLSGTTFSSSKKETSIDTEDASDEGG